MEYVDGGELFSYVDDCKGLPEDETVYIFRQIVSALLYCHRLLICHRDLKPENILLNREHLGVKLIDFGMAALQPPGRQLSTPCGSPHYAAPEVISSRPYDGRQADVWSCGVILYVMLTGSTPYNYPANGDIRMLFSSIGRAQYWMPPELSAEAKDLIRRIFVPNPQARITMDEVWDHPFMHKYDARFGLDGPSASKEAAIGPIPTATDLQIDRIQDIDREILRNMRTLWHSEPETALVKKLLSNDINQEKLFYAALVKHREETLENYVGPDEMDYSHSDYHHGPVDARQTPPVSAPRSQSQYSIMNDEHLKPSRSFDPVPSESSYDPYRASKDPIVDDGGEYNVTVYRNGSAGNARTSRSLRKTNLLHADPTKRARSSRTSTLASSSITRSGRSKGSIQRSSASRHSVVSSGTYRSSPPAVPKIRRSDIHKRGVSFGHLRRTSTVSALVSPESDRTPPTPSLPDTFRYRRARPGARPANPQPPSSSPEATQQVPRSRKDKAATPRIKVRKPDSPVHVMRNDIRKHSAELEKACEEAFFRSSVGSNLTAQTTFSEKNGVVETPPSSVSHQSGGKGREMNVPRPLPALPKDTPNTYLTRTLEETREKLAAYQGGTGEDNTAKFEEVMKMLETIMPGTGGPHDKRVSSAPEPKTPEKFRQLPIISEESDARSAQDHSTNWHRSVTAPVPTLRKREDQTVRMVPPSSPAGTVAPLNVRKRTSVAELRLAADVEQALDESIASVHAVCGHEASGALLTVVEDAPPSPAPQVIRKKRSNWFGLSKTTGDLVNRISAAKTPQEGDAKKDARLSRVLIKPAPPPTDKALPQEPSSAQSSEFPIRKKRFGGGKKGFSKWLGRIGGDKEETTGEHAEPMAGSQTHTHAANTVHTSLDSLFSTTSPAPSSDDSPPSPAASPRSWFARFFHLKPATHILCFSIPRGRARTELALLLAAWQRAGHGVRDVRCDRAANSLSARVERPNALDIRPVAFRVEMFVVLEHGRKVGLSIARFVQVSGARSGFEKVLEVLEGVVKGRGWLVEDREKWKALCEVVGG